jgi:hypothetical protein
VSADTRIFSPSLKSLQDADYTLIFEVPSWNRAELLKKARHPDRPNAFASASIPARRYSASVALPPSIGSTASPTRPVKSWYSVDCILGYGYLK